MKFTPAAQWQQAFNQLSDRLLGATQSNEALTLSLVAEHSQFLRFRGAQVRQAGMVSDGRLTLQLLDHQRTAKATVPFRGHLDQDLPLAQAALDMLRQEIEHLPLDPFQVLPQDQGSSDHTYIGQLLDPDHAAAAILPWVEGQDFTGLYAAGPLIRATANSTGQRHWFATDAFILDYSLIAGDNAVKGVYAGRHWQEEAFCAQIQRDLAQLQQLCQPPKLLSPGRYRVYLAPAAVAELVSMLSWGAISEAALQQGESALALLRQGQPLSPLFSLIEDFSQGTVPQFNELGEIAPLKLPLIVAGKLENTLVSTRTAKEYGLTANGADLYEGLRSPHIAAGNLAEAEILSTLGQGLYLSNLHYLNWSDRPKGRITGMTRYACFWVDNGEIVAPIANLRFDESLYHFWGAGLKAIGDRPVWIPAVESYEYRALGGCVVPGMIVDNFTFTL